jgi:hypothetical protein
MRRFYVADLDVRGEVRATAEYQYEHLERVPGAAELIVHFATLIWSNPEEFETTLPHGRTHMAFRWRASAATAGICTLRSHDELASLGLLASGLDPDADHLTLDAFQKHLLRELHGTEFEAGFGLMELKERPLVAVINFLEPPDDTDQLVLALADRCFAAAYFRFQNLA